MQLTPRYGPDPIISLDGPPSAIADLVIRQRRRLADELAGLDEEGWTHPSRCDRWANRDVISHLVATNQFWSFSIAMGLKGEPTRFLATFDPVASPAQLVADAPQVTTGDLLAQFVATSEALAQQVGALDDAGWQATVEAPAGHVAISTLAHHALWDALVHERDILLPLGLTPVEEADETLASLRFAAALSPAFALSRDEAPTGALGVAPSDADGSFTVTVTDHVAVTDGIDGADRSDGTGPVLRGPAVELLEALSLRAPLPSGLPADVERWLEGLKVTFDQA
ncbi:MAG: hypothetical protein JWO77_328 [Ilumatobacteraceae bacterium]|nr:hypothetical protein [Ilumatobacteraceae bacterium]